MLLKVALIVLIVIHGAIHIIGYTRMQREEPATSKSGLLWYLTAILCLLSVLLLLLDQSYWWIAGSLAMTLSQLLILQSWEQAKWGTIINILLFVLMIAALLGNECAVGLASVPR